MAWIDSGNPIYLKGKRKLISRQNDLLSIPNNASKQLDSSKLKEENTIDDYGILV